ncbi:MAG: bifunctional adenosylcobinamide kinase/adenosylcobinamide-phosphate guanylyltransferase [Candidatus Rokubacteria bacterium]|nr:bifunctional adenosylcobinamide kinase/adenosylcobinamide-phosphate guanylyltransferase [Candidatus Rokubacteria bacterium]
MPTSHLVLGGARSGKSRFALSIQPAHGRVAFVATAEAGDADMAARIARHQAERSPRWLTVEEPRALVAALERLADRADAVLVDCLTLWVANRLLGGDSDAAIVEDADALTALIGRGRYDLTLVSNEVGEGVHPPTEQGLRFRDLMGLVNQRVAAACDRVTLMVAGLPLTIKAPAPYDVTLQAP